jgi:hypothetical protein
MNPDDIDVTADDPPIYGPPDPVSKLTIDNYDIFQGDVISYSHLMS